MVLLHLVYLVQRMSQLMDVLFGELHWILVHCHGRLIGFVAYLVRNPDLRCLQKQLTYLRPALLRKIDCSPAPVLLLRLNFKEIHTDNLAKLPHDTIKGRLVHRAVNAGDKDTVLIGVGRHVANAMDILGRVRSMFS